jgi:hypothetical protein
VDRQVKINKDDIDKQMPRGYSLSVPVVFLFPVEGDGPFVTLIAPAVFKEMML